MSDRCSSQHTETRSPQPARIVAAALALAGLVALASCRTGALWVVPDDLRVSERAVASALDDVPPAPSVTDPAILQAIPVIPMLKSTRPCCAFGNALQTSIGGIPVPGYSIGNLREIRDLGPHRYDNGALTIAMNDERGWTDQEANGLVYTCRGGFVDTAHVRDYADATLYLSLSIARKLTTGGDIPLSNEGGVRRVRLRAVDPATIAGFGRRANDLREGRMAAEIAAWVAYQASIWHEIATWYGYHTVDGFPEKLSAFSPEDLYSNQLGVRIARAILLERGLIEAASYDRRMDVWLRQVLDRLGATTKPIAEAAIRSVDGSWWDSHRRIPDWRLVRRRFFEIGPVLYPLQVPASEQFGCAPSTVVPLEVREGIGGSRFEEIATLEIDVAPELARVGLRLPEPGSSRITPAAFPAIIEEIRRENEAAFGDPELAPRVPSVGPS